MRIVISPFIFGILSEMNLKVKQFGGVFSYQLSAISGQQLVSDTRVSLGCHKVLLLIAECQYKLQCEIEIKGKLNCTVPRDKTVDTRLCIAYNFACSLVGAYWRRANYG